ncbi:MAG: hypothetical protein H7Z40_13405 [Phycisphaerae bacterium]|nr:hypothetical protein [Gemmatimonadaceae bacterium]
MSTTFSAHHIVPEGRAMLACSCVLPDTWVQEPPAAEEYDLDNPAVFIPLVVCMAPYGAVVFTIAARPAFDSGAVQDWAEYLATQNGLTVESIREARVNRMPCIVIDATMPSEVGVMRSRSVFLEDGRRLFNIGALAPEAIWASVKDDFDRLLGAFALDDVQGITAAPMREMSSEGVVDLTALSAGAQPGVAGPGALSSSADAGDRAEGLTPNASAAGEPPAHSADSSHESPAQAADVALADDAATLDPDHPINARLRGSGAGLVPRVLSVVASEKYAVVEAAAVESLFRVPFGWHVTDDGKRTLIFDVAGNVQINLSLRPALPDGIYALLTSIGDDLAAENPQALFLKMELQGMPCLAVRDLLIDGVQLDQAYLARPSHRSDCALVCRITAARSEMERAVNTAEVVLSSMQAGSE